MKDGRIVQIGTPEEIVMNPADDYVREFVQGISKLKLVKAHSIMEPMESHAGGERSRARRAPTEDSRPRPPHRPLRRCTDQPVVITEGGQDVGIVTKPRLLRGIQGGKE